MHSNPLIYPSCAMREGKYQPSSSATKNPPSLQDKMEQKGDLLIRNLYQIGTDSIHNICVMNNDVLSYQNKLLEKCFQTAERGKKYKYLDSCL